MSTRDTPRSESVGSAKLMVSFFFVPVVVGLHWKRGTRSGALAAMFGGMAACFFWAGFGKPYFLGLDAAEAGILASALLFVVVSLFTRPVPERCLRLFFRREAAGDPASARA